MDSAPPWGLSYVRKVTLPMLRYLPAVLGVAAVVNLAACEDEARVRVRQPRTEYVVAAPRQEVVVTQPRVTEVVTVAQPRTEVITVAQPRTEVVAVAQPRVEEVIVQEGPPVEHIRVAPTVMYEGRRVYWYGNRWYYQNGGRWSYYGSEPIGLRGRRY
jgi:hypothetical protein